MTAARSSNGRSRQAGAAAVAASMASDTSEWVALAYEPRTAACRCGWTTFSIEPDAVRCTPPMTCLMSVGFAAQLGQLGLEPGARGAARRVVVDRFVDRGGNHGHGIHRDPPELVRLPLHSTTTPVAGRLGASDEVSSARPCATVNNLGLEVLGTDLYGLAQTLAGLTRGMVSIEDDSARVLAYSASDETADELRRLSILGRAGPSDYLQHLQDWGVYDRLRRSDEVIEVPADDELGIRPRLVISIRADAERTAGHHLGPAGRRAAGPRLGRGAAGRRRRRRADDHSHAERADRRDRADRAAARGPRRRGRRPVDRRLAGHSAPTGRRW